MGSYSHLYLADERAPASLDLLSDASPYLLSKYHVPLFWLALFEWTDVVDAAVDEAGEAWPHLVKPRTDAIALFSAREPAIAASFPLCQAEWIVQFKAMLEQTPLEHVHVETSEIGSMVCTPSVWRRELQAMLGIFAQPREKEPEGFLAKLLTKPKPLEGAWAVFHPRFGDAYRGQHGEGPWPYCGASGTKTVMAWEVPSWT